MITNHNNTIMPLRFGHIMPPPPPWLPKKYIKQKKLPNKFNYLSCDIEPAENTYNILKKIISSKIVFDFISFEHDKYNIGDKYEKLSIEYLKNHNYKIAVNGVYSRNKKYKVYETWFIKNEINFKEISYPEWKKKFYKDNKFIF